MLGQSGIFAGQGYELVAVEANDLTAPLVGAEEVHEMPREYSLSNYPNPFSGVTTIEYTVPHSSFISITVFDLLGRTVAQLADGFALPGKYRTHFDARGLQDGLYFYRLQAGSEMIVGKIMVRE